MSATTSTPIAAGVRIGHVHLKVADIDRALKFWHDVLGFEIVLRRPGAVFLAAGGYHHHIALNTWESAGGAPPPKGTTGLYHVAIVYPNRAELAGAFKRLIDAGIPLTGASDHGVSEALYLDDPDGNGVELYRDRPEHEWPRTDDGKITMYTKKLDLENLLAAAPVRDSTKCAVAPDRVPSVAEVYLGKPSVSCSAPRSASRTGAFRGHGGKTTPARHAPTRDRAASAGEARKG